MSYRRSLKIAVVLIAFCLLMSQGTQAVESPNDELTEDQLYQAYTDYYFLKREVSFSAEMTIRESFLKWLFEGINVEVAKRQREDLTLTYQAINPPELVGFEESSYKIPDNIGDAPIRIQYKVWEQHRQDEFNHKFLRARLIKDRLISSADLTQLHRMYRHDLKSALEAYRDGLYSDAIMRLTEVIDAYDYEYTADVQFYRAESFFALQMYTRAVSAFEADILTDENIDHRRISLERLIAIAGDRGDTEKLLESWAKYQEMFGDNLNGQYWLTLDLVARYLMLAGDVENALILFDQILPSEDQFIPSKLLVAECYFALDNLDSAESRFSLLLGLELDNVEISPEVNAQAMLKLGYIAFMRDDFGQALNNFVAIRKGGYLKDAAEISIVWALFRLGDYENALKVGRYFYNKYSTSHYFYEAAAIIGASAEILGQDSLANAKYEELIDAASKYREYQEVNYEKEALNDLVVELIPLETELFVNNQTELFPRYLYLRRTIDQLNEKIVLYEGSKSHSIIEDLVLERARLRAVLKDHEESRKTVSDLSVSKMRSERKLSEKYSRNLFKIEDLLSQVNDGIQNEMAKKTLIQREAEQEYFLTTREVTNRQYANESEAVENSIAAVKELSVQARQTNDPKLMVDFTGLELQFAGLVDELAYLNISINSFQELQVRSNLDQWSKFAIKRSIYGGLDFEDYHTREQQLQELDQYIQQLNAVLAARKRIAERDEGRVTAFVSEVSSNAEQYFAPPVPMWNPKVSGENSTSTKDSAVDKTPLEPDSEPQKEPESNKNQEPNQP